MQNFLRIAGLDLLRTAAIITVVLHHSVILLIPTIKLPYIGWLIGKLLAMTDPFGILGVELFFVLSGFLIGKILITTFEHSSFELNDLWSFWKKRWLRTLPNYYLCLIGAALTYYFSVHEMPDWRYFFFLQNLYSPHPPFFPEAWSLAIEEWFYLSFPIFLWIICCISPRTSRSVLFRNTSLAYLLFFLLLRLLNAFAPVYGNYGSYLLAGFDMGIRKIVLFRLDSLMYGVIMAYFHFYKTEMLIRFRKQLLVAGISCTILTTFFFYLGYHPAFNFYNTSKGFRFFCDAFAMTFFPLFLSFLLPYFSGKRTISNKKLLSVITYISKISYSVYLIHFSILLPLFLIESQSSVMAIALFSAYWIFVIITASILYRFVEKPFMRLR